MSTHKIRTFFLHKSPIFSSISTTISQSMSITTSCFRQFSTTKFPHSIPSPIFKTLISPPKNPQFFKSISIQRIPTTTIQYSPSPPPSISLQPIEDLPPKLQEIVKLFQTVQEPKAKYEQLLFYGKNLNPLDGVYKNGENKVKGCVSQVWVKAFFDGNGNVVFEADSDSVLTKVLAALLVNGLSGSSVEEIVRVKPDFAVLLGLQQSLTPSRNNGFLNMLKLMQKKALELYVEAERSVGGDSDEKPVENNDGGSGNDLKVVEVSSEVGGGGGGGFGSNDSGNVVVGLGNRGERIREKLERELKPVELKVEDISYQHAGHSGVRGSDGETHFNVRVVSEEFEGKSLVKRHRVIYGLLQDEMESGLHALSIEAKTPAEVGSS